MLQSSVLQSNTSEVSHLLATAVTCVWQPFSYTEKLTRQLQAEWAQYILYQDTYTDMHGSQSLHAIS